MTPQMLRNLIISSLIALGKPLECTQKNTSCSDIKTDVGFKFSHGGHARSTISVVHNKTTIAYASLGSQFFDYLSEVMSMDNDSIITHNCRDLLIQCIVPKGDYVEETCVKYIITEPMENLDSPTPWGLDKPMENLDSPTPWGLIVGVSLGVIGVLILIFGICYWLTNRQGADGVHQDSFLTYLTRTCLRRGTSQPETGGIGLDEMPSASDPPRSEENGIEQDGALERVVVHSIDPTDDDMTPQTLRLDHNLSNEGIQPSKKGDISAPDVNRASNHRAMHRSVRDDPGGLNEYKDITGNRKMHNGWTPHDDDPEGHENVGQPLLLNQGAAIQGSDMTGQAAVLVNRRGSDRDQVSRCSTVPDPDVKLAVT